MVRTFPYYSCSNDGYLFHTVLDPNNRCLVVKVTSATIAGSFDFIPIGSTIEKCYP